MKKELTEQQEELKERVKEEIEYIDEDLQVHFSFPDKDKFHIDIIEDYVSHLHIRGTFENDCMEITSISSHITQSNTQSILSLVADLMNDF